METSTTRLQAISECGLCCGTPPKFTNDNRTVIAALVGSSCYEAFADDAAKDEDNAGWVLELENSLHQAWIERIRWIRLVDRLAEQDLLCAKESGFLTLLEGWRGLKQNGSPPLDNPHYAFLEEMRRAWFGQHGQAFDEGAIAAWDRYIGAIARYHKAHLTIETIQEYEQLLTDLGGAFFQTLPFLPPSQRQAASYLGMLDQFYNHLRDLEEDSAHGICYLPTELLEQFGVSREVILTHQIDTHPNYIPMMQFWLDDYLPRLRRKARPFITNEALHPSWQCLCEWSLYRYRRIETVFRKCNFDYIQFSQVYWPQVKAELPLMRRYLRQQQALPTRETDSVASYGVLRGWKKLTILPTPEFNIPVLPAI